MIHPNPESRAFEGAATPQVWQLLYCSHQTYEMEAADMLKLLFDARAFNRDNSITGLLLHHGGQFMQLLEGDQHDVLRLYRKIAEDSRHRDVVIEVNAQADQRLFPQWGMGYAEAPEMDGHPALAGAESERDAISHLCVLAPDHMPAARLLQFLRDDR